MKKILVVDDDPVSRDLLSEVLTKQGFEVRLSESAEMAVLEIEKEDFPVILTDVRMHKKSGFDLLREAKALEVKKSLPSVVLLMTGFGSMEGALEAIREGAFDYISKPFQISDLRTLVSRAWKQVEHLRGVQPLPTPTEAIQSTLSYRLVGKSPQMVEVYRWIARASLSSSTVFIYGEKGTGKALVARAIHDHSTRKSGAFLRILGPEDFLRIREKIQNSTDVGSTSILVEEIDRFGTDEQTQLLSLLENEETRGFRWLFSSRRPLSELHHKGRFRDDLLERISTLPIEIPALRTRLEDLPELCGVILDRMGDRVGRMRLELSPAALEFLSTYSWPGNVRELVRVLERSAMMGSRQRIEVEDLQASLEMESRKGVVLSHGSQAVPASASLEEVERTHILRVLGETGFNKSRASEILGIDRATLYRKAKHYQIDLSGGV